MPSQERFYVISRRFLNLPLIDNRALQMAIPILAFHKKYVTDFLWGVTNSEKK